MAKVETITIDGVLYSKHAKTLGSKDNAKVLGYSHLPRPHDGVKTEDDYAEWLGDLVEKGVLSWKQVATSLYDIVLQEHSKILREYDALVKGSGFNLALAGQKYHAECSGIADFAEYEKALRTCWDRDNAGDPSSWDADEHSLFPRDVR